MTKVFLLTADAMRYDVIQNEEPPTPNIASLLDNGVSYERAFSNGCSTAIAFPAILYSADYDKGRTPPCKKSIGHHFQDLGFETIGVTSNPFTSTYFGYGPGFDVFKDYGTPTREKAEKSHLFKIGKQLAQKIQPVYNYITKFRVKHSLPYKRAANVNNDIVQNLREGADQFFWAHYMDTHAPYSPPEEYGQKYCPTAFKQRADLTQKLYSGKVSAEDRKRLWQLYLSEVKYLDDQIGKLLEKIRGLSEEVYIVFTSDHGEAFGERGHFKHSHYFKENIHVPLSFLVPGQESRKEQKLASHLDIMPTLLSLFGQKAPADVDGINLFTERRAALRITPNNTTVILTADWKLIEHDGESYLFNISETLEETENHYNSRPDVVDELKRRAINEINEVDI